MSIVLTSEITERMKIVIIFFVFVILEDITGDTDEWNERRI
ncbi:hypothetical protein [Draconibacterium sediminis]|nr:hypothetical protein [Draconibacterium sediminis]